MESDHKQKAAAPTAERPAARAKAAAERALAEAAARRAQYDAKHPREVNGRDGPDPVRYGDWEVRGLASDF
ncbi:MAG TPA: DUF1674 domain-containing protein [Roseiarcus sp.]|nr:DUF1674 domain-containing protein [Roseiarcus sp.]